LEATSESVNIKDRSNSTKNYEIAFDYQGSILSTLKEELLPPSLLQCKKLLKEIKSLDLLDPEHLRKRTRESSGTIGLGGQNLAAFLHELNSQKKQELFSLLKQVYPQLKFLRAKSLPSGWKQIEIFETYTSAGSGLNPLVKTEARHINDGMLRLMAILAELMTENRFLLFDEIENGINPELVEFITDRLVNANQQVLVTTHSPLILNYLEDDIAKKGVIYLFRNSQGHTKSIPFFSIPSMAEKLKVMGPGEVYADTNLTELADEIVEVAGEGK
jgi:predicted ATPase